MRNFINDTLLGSLILLPIFLVIGVYQWLIGALKDVLEPLRSYLPDIISQSTFLTTFIIFDIVIAFLFVMGLALRTSLGRWIHSAIETHILMPYAPGYKFIVKTVSSFLPSKDGKEKSKPFKQAVIAYPYNSDTFVVGLLTAEHERSVDHSHYGTDVKVVYVPTSPIPSSGQILMVPAERVFPLQGVSIDDVLRPIVGMGVSMDYVFQAHEEALKKMQDENNDSKN